MQGKGRAERFDLEGAKEEDLGGSYGDEFHPAHSRRGGGIWESQAQGPR